MTNFTASNGAEIASIEHGGVSVRDGFSVAELTSRHRFALSQLLQREQDLAFGRWRYSDQIVVYPNTPDTSKQSRGVRVLDETTGFYHQRWEDRPTVGGGAEIDDYGLAAHAYFIAHPESKPWHDAEPGEVWLLTLKGVAGPQEAGRTTGGDLVFWPITGKPGFTPQHDPTDFTDGRRIYPDEATA